jgi:hypothetical protein
MFVRPDSSCSYFPLLSVSAIKFSVFGFNGPLIRFPPLLPFSRFGASVFSRVRAQDFLQFVEARKCQLDILSGTFYGAQKLSSTAFFISVYTNDIALHSLVSAFEKYYCFYGDFVSRRTLRIDYGKRGKANYFTTH